VSVALHHYICFVVVAHHVPRNTVPANRPHRPVSAPAKRSPRAETGQPVRTQYGVRGRRLARRLHPCAPAARPPFDARPKWSSALKRWTLRKIALLARGAAGNSLASKGRVSRKETTGVRRLRQNLRSLGGADQEAPCAGRLAPDRFSIRAALVEPASRQTRKQAECPACRRVGCSSTVPTRATERCRLAFGSAGRTGFNAGVRPVKYAGMQTGKPSHGPEGRQPRLRAGQRSALTPRRSILAAGILKKHEGFGGVLQLPAHPI
jgi:hypothetical protein